MTSLSKILILVLFLGSSSTSLAWMNPPWEFVSTAGEHWPSGGGDVNGDGYDDVLVGNAVYFGRNFGVDTTPSQILPQSHAQASSFMVGDLNGDRYADAIMIDHEGTEGLARVFKGGPFGLTFDQNIVLPTEILDQPMGWARGLSDVNGDGFDDVALSPNLHQSRSYRCDTTPSVVQVFYGGSDGISATPEWVYETNDESCLGDWMEAGDFNADGYNDLAISAPWKLELPTPLTHNRRGRVFVFNGGPQGLSSTPNWQMSLNLPSESLFIFGQSLTAGDVDGDGFDDLITRVGVVGEKETLVFRDYTYFGSPQGLGSTWLSKDVSEEAGLEEFTLNVGDIDNSRGSDFLSPTESQRQGIFLGPMDWTAPVVGYELGPEYFRIRWAAAGDVNGDGFDDWAGTTYGNIDPKIYVFFGRANPAPTADAQTISLLENTTADVDLTGADPYGDVLQFGIGRPPAHGRIAGFSESTGKLQYIPGLNFSGSDSFEFAVMDPFGGKSTAEVLLEVGSVNHAPVFIPPTPADSVEIYAARKFRLVVRAQDDDLDLITYSVAGQPWNAQFSPETGVTYWTPDNTQLGPHVWTFTATDGTDSLSRTVVLKVLEAAEEPIEFEPDAGRPDGGVVDAETPKSLANSDSGCGCNQTGGGSSILLGLLMIFGRRKRKNIVRGRTQGQ